MITEDYISFEVAKLLKEKGFDEPVNCFYFINGTFTNNAFCTKNSYTRHYAAPTLQMAMKWLREVYDLHIDVFIGITEDNSYTYWTYFITDLKGNMIFSAYGDDIDFKGENYEQTIESAIKCCLTELIK